MSPGEIWKLLDKTWSEFNADDGARIGAAIAYYTVFAVAPILMIALVVTGAVFGEAAARGELSTQLRNLVGPVGAQAVEVMVERTGQAHGGLVATLIGLATIFLGATSVFVVLQDTLNKMWDVPPRPESGILKLLRTRLLSFTMVVVMGFLLLVSLVISATLAALGGWLGAWLTVPPIALRLADQAATLVIVGALFATLFKLLPDRKVAWSDVWVGALVTAIAFMVGRWAIGQYLGNSGFASAYGAAGSFVVFLVWVYYSAQILLLGAEFTQVWARAHGSMCIGGDDSRGIG